MPIQLKKKTNSISIDGEYRKHVKSRLEKLLSSHIPMELLIQLEEEIHKVVVMNAKEKGITDNSNKKFNDLYKMYISRIINHLHPESQIKNTYLLPKLLSGEITPKEIAEMRNESEMNPYHWRCAQQKAVEALKISHGIQSALSDLIPCGKCGGKTAYEEKQTRSCDEAMTVKVYCPNCNIKFVV
jgi:DNA-directed RNA polymerase subunit M/transcription elongation factor TFIIS